MSTTITVPEGFHYLVPAVTSTILLLMGQNRIVDHYRKLSGIKYPQLYAEKKEAEASKAAHLFNCAQRAHQNTLENIPVIYAITLVVATRYPIYASSVMGLWTLSRASHTRGYLTGDEKKRINPIYMAGIFSMFSLIGISIYISGEYLLAGLAGVL